MKINSFYSGLILGATFFMVNANASVVMLGSRIIFPQTLASKTLEFSNPDNEPAIIQLQMVDEDKQPNNDTPFTLVPPVFRIEPHMSQSVRIINNGKKLIQDRESLFYLEFKQIPLINKHDSSSNKLLITISNQVKLFSRPIPLEKSKVFNLTDSIKYSIINNELILSNSSAFYVSIVSATLQDVNQSIEVINHYMLAPFSNIKRKLPGNNFHINKPILKLTILNDSGGKREVRL